MTSAPAARRALGACVAWRGELAATGEAPRPVARALVEAVDAIAEELAAAARARKPQRVARALARAEDAARRFQGVLLGLADSGQANRKTTDHAFARLWQLAGALQRARGEHRQR